MVLALTGVAVIMGGILAYVNHLTEGPINAQKAKALADGIKSVMCVSDLTVANTDTVRENDAKGKELTYIVYHIQDAQQKDLGAAVESTTGATPCLNMLRRQGSVPRPTVGSRRVRRVTSSVSRPKNL